MIKQTVVENERIKNQYKILRGSPGSQVLRGTRSASPVGTFSIYSFDGRLLSEYDIYGTCIRDYIYMGTRLIAEYRPQEGKYYYYTSDQINSTRIVTNDSGAVVYAADHDPFGGIQKTWTSTYDPSLKFSGKERSRPSDLQFVSPFLSFLLIFRLLYILFPLLFHYLFYFLPYYFLFTGPSSMLTRVD